MVRMLRDSGYDPLIVENLAIGHAQAAESLPFEGGDILDGSQHVTPDGFCIRAFDPPSLVADLASARAELGWAPQYAGLDTIIAHAWPWEQRLHQAAHRP